MRFQHKNTPKYADADPGISEPVLVSRECFNVPFHIPCVVFLVVEIDDKVYIVYIHCMLTNKKLFENLYIKCTQSIKKIQTGRGRRCPNPGTAFDV